MLPGSCWPMAGSTGQLTLKLDHPVTIKAVSVDHVSWEIVPEGKHTSAPKRIIVFGYPPCESATDDCTSLGFDIQQEFEVARFSYDVEDGTSIQTFDSHYGQAIENQKALSKVEDTYGDDSDSCSSNESGSCSVPPRIDVAAVTFRVLENWGHPGE